MVEETENGIVRVQFKFEERDVVYDAGGDRGIIIARRALIAGQSVVIDYLLDYGKSEGAVWVYDTSIDKEPFNIS